MAAAPVHEAATPPPPPASPSSHHASTTALDASLIGVVLLLSLLLQHALRSRWLCNSLTRILTGGGVCMLLGCAANATLYFVSRFDVGLQGHLSLKEWDTAQTHDLIYFGLLPPIIFEAGFHMNKSAFFQNIGAVLGYALLGTVLAIIVTGGLVYALGMHVLWTQFTLVQALVFGALISSTDPVATLGILKTVRATPLLYQLIFGESALNDALSIVLFHVFLRAALGSSEANAAPMHVGPAELWGIALDVVRVCGGSVLLGVLWALGSAALTRKLRGAAKRGTHPHASFELALLLLFALLSYTTAEECGFSGVMSLFVSALVMRHYTFYNLSSHAQRSAKALLTTLSETCETCLSVLLGIVFLDYLIVSMSPQPDTPSHSKLVIWDLPFVALALPVLLIARAANIVCVSALANLGRHADERITARMQLVMWFSGMRGPLSFALAVTLPGAQDAQHHIAGHPASPDAQWSVPINTVTLAITLITNLLMAPLTGPLVSLLDLQADDERRMSRLTGNNTPRHTLDAASEVAAAAEPDATGAVEEAGLAAAAAAPAGSDDGGAGVVAAGGLRMPTAAVGSATNGLATPLMLVDPVSGSVSAIGRAPNAGGGGGGASLLPLRPSACLRAFKLIDAEYLKPIFGGRIWDDVDVEDEDD